MRNTLCCTIQNKLGAFDRVIGTLTHRGLMLEQMMASIDPETGHMQVFLTFDCDDDHAMEKLIKALHKQIYVLEIQQVFTASEVANLLEYQPKATRLAAVSVG